MPLPSSRREYSIRMNFSDTPNTFRAVNVLQRDVDLAGLGQYAQFTPGFQPGTAPTRYDGAPLPGFLALQLQVDRFILNSSVASLSVMSEVNLAGWTSTVAGSASIALPELRTELPLLGAAFLNPATTVRAAQVAQGLLNWMGSERYAPHRVSMVPFPIVGFETNGFYGIVQNLFPFFFVLCEMFPVAMLLRGMVQEKESKLRESLKMMGVNSAAVTYSWVVQYTLFYIVQALLISLIGSGTMFKSSDFGATFLLFFLFGLSSVAFIVLIAVFFSRTKTATLVGVLLYLAMYFVYTATSGDDIAFEPKLASSLAGPTAFSLGIKTLAIFEDQGVGVKLGVNSADLVRNYSFDTAIYMMVLDTIIYLVLAWYCDEVLPSSLREFGVPRPFYFPFTASYWREVFGVVGGEHDVVEGVMDGKKFKPAGAGHKLFEQPSTDLLSRGSDDKCVAIRSLRREFGKFTAVNDIDLDCFENQITVILGHNGAGKSTTFNMLTGLLPPTSGGGLVYGKSMSTHMSEIRHSLGVCPQHDVLWPLLTVVEHLHLFAEVKNMPVEAIAPAIEEAIGRVGLTEKRHVLSSSLSGGQKRKLSVAIALLGDPKLVILDEPTSGMDPYSRRATWDMLRTAREGRTTILTTHFLDEADLLGDRIAIMSHGEVKCCGSPIFLKSKLGAGYEMTIVKRQRNADSEYGCNSDKIIRALLAHVPIAKVASNIGAEMRINLPFTASSAFPAMFDEFDADMAKTGAEQVFGIVTYGVSVTSIESVFLAVASDEFDKLAAAASHDIAASVSSPGKEAAGASAAGVVSPERVAVSPVSSTAAEVVEDKELMEMDPEDGGIAHATLGDVRERARRDEFTCCGRFWTHFYAMICKRYAYQKRDFRFVCCSILLPGFLVIIGLALLIGGQLTSWPSLRMSTAQFNVKRVDGALTNLPNYVPFMGYDAAIFPTIADTFPGQVVQAGVMPNITAELIEATTIIPNTFGFFNASATPVGDQTKAVALQLGRMSSHLLARRSEHAAARYGAVVLGQEFYRPFNKSLAEAPEAVLFINTTGRHASAVYANLLSTALAKAGINPAVNSITIINDPLPFTASQSLIFGQFSSLSAALIIVIAFAFVSLAPISFVVRERETSAKHQQQLAGISISSYWISSFLWDFVSYLVPMLITIIAAVAYNLTEFITPDDGALSAFVVLLLMYGLCGTAFAYFIGHFFSSHTGAQVAVQLAGVLSLILVIASFVMSFIQSTCEADKTLRFFYRLLPGFALGNGLLQLSFLSSLPLLESICEGNPSFASEKSYNAWDVEAAGYNILYLGILTVVYLALAILIDVYRNNPSAQNCFRAMSSALGEPPVDTDDDVKRERERIQSASEEDLRDDVVVLNRLSKVYPGGKKAVQGLSFGVKVGQVFGFLGINGAGKTSTLKMLSGDLLPSPGGGATIAGYDILSQQDQVRRLLGYCPQFDALLDLVTVREHLTMFARIKGVAESAIPALVVTKMEEMNLTQYADRVASALSGGNRRKLSMAIALVSEPPVVFADEPSTGMDPKARRSMWKIILRIARSKGTSVVLTSHSMEEVEALCSRVGIMVGGRMRCLGSIQHLKNKFGRGWMLEVRQLATTDEIVEEMQAKARSAGVVTSVATEGGGSDECVVNSRFAALFHAIGRSGWGEEIHPKRSGWMVYDAVTARPGNDVPLPLLASWMAEQARAQDLVDFVTKAAFKADDTDAPRLIERHGLKFRFRLPPQEGMSLGDMFRAMEAGREPHSIADYSIGQTSLEQIFNQFAAEQDEEKGEVAGMSNPAASSAKTGKRATGVTSDKVESPLAAATASASAVAAITK